MQRGIGLAVAAKLVIIGDIAPISRSAAARSRAHRHRAGCGSKRRPFSLPTPAWERPFHEVIQPVHVDVGPELALQVADGQVHVAGSGRTGRLQQLTGAGRIHESKRLQPVESVDHNYSFRTAHPAPEGWRKTGAAPRHPEACEEVHETGIIGCRYTPESLLERGVHNLPPIHIDTTDQGWIFPPIRLCQAHQVRRQTGTQRF